MNILLYVGRRNDGTTLNKSIDFSKSVKENLFNIKAQIQESEELLKKAVSVRVMPHERAVQGVMA